MNDNYYKLISEELLIKLHQIKCFVKKHNLTIGILTEEILRSFLKDYLPKSISVSQGFIIYTNGNLSKQCDIIIYDSMNYAVKYKINDIVIVPFDSVICVIEVKTTITKSIFHKTIENFETLMSTYMYDSIGLYPNHPDVFYSITYTGIFDELVKIRHIGLKRYLLK